MSNELAIVEPDKFEVMKADPRAVYEIIRSNLGGGLVTQYTLDNINIPSGGGLAFEIPVLEGQKIAQEFTGVVIGFKDPATSQKLAPFLSASLRSSTPTSAFQRSNVTPPSGYMNVLKKKDSPFFLRVL